MSEPIDDLQQLLGGLVAQPAPPPPQPSADDQAESDRVDGFDKLQELLVKPEIVTMQQQIARIESVMPEWESLKEKVTQLEETIPELAAIRDKVDQLEAEGLGANQIQIVKLLMPLISELMDQKFAQLEANLQDQIAAIPGGSGMAPQSLSFRVRGIDPDTPTISD